MDASAPLVRRSVGVMRAVAWGAGVSEGAVLREDKAAPGKAGIVLDGPARAGRPGAKTRGGLSCRVALNTPTAP